MRVLIVDDEPLSRAALEDILRTRPDIEHFESVRDSFEATEKLGTGTYDVMLLDINMPEVSGIDLVNRLTANGAALPSIIFVTAHDQYAIAAFEQHAVDYVLKPFTSERIHAALDAAHNRTAAERAKSMLEALPQLQSLARKPSSRIAIKTNGRIVFINPADVVAVEAEGNYVLLQQRAGSYLLRESISAMAEKLKPYGFIRIHRSVLINSSYVAEIEPCLTGEYALRIRGGKEYTVTRTYKKSLRSLAEFWIGTDSFLAE
jgi:two-component system, LytTR family, response regulator